MKPPFREMCEIFDVVGGHAPAPPLADRFTDSVVIAAEAQASQVNAMTPIMSRFTVTSLVS